MSTFSTVKTHTLELLVLLIEQRIPNLKGDCDNMGGPEGIREVSATEEASLCVIALVCGI